MTGWLIETLIATTGLILLVLMIRIPIRRWFGAPVAYALWLLPAARAVLPTFTRTVERVVPATSHPIDLAALPYNAAVPTSSPDWPLLLSAAWIAGALAMLVRGAITYHRQRSGILGN